MGHRVTNPLPGLTILAAFSDNGFGTGFLSVSTSSSVAWKPPGESSPGSAVELAPGETAVVAGPDGVGRLVVRRDTSSDLDTSSDPARVFVDGRKPVLEELLQLDAAIEAVEKQAQSASAGEDNLNRAKLAELDARKRRLERRLGRIDGTRPTLLDLTMGGA